MQKVRKGMVLVGAWGAAMVGSVVSGRADSIAEGFDNLSGSVVPIVSASAGETIVRTASSRFAWGGYSQSGSAVIGTLKDDPSKHCSLYFDAGAFLPGNYAYTRFDSTTNPASGAHTPSRRIDLSPAESRVIVTVYWSWYNVKVAVLLRDKDRWWRSSDIDIAAIAWNQRLDTRYVRDPKALSWVRLNNTADMDEVDDGGAVALTDGPAGTPDWTSIEGMGLMCRSGTSADKVYIAGLSLTDGNVPKANLAEPMKNSDVAFLHVASPVEKYDEYGGPKVVTWDSGWQAKHVSLTRDHGVRDSPAASMGVVSYSQISAGTPLAEAIARDLWGNEIIEKDNPNFPNGWQARLCIRYSAFEDYVKDYVKRRIYDVGAREALMDEPSGYNGGAVCYRNDAGCYCDRCNNGFREWLRSRYTTEALVGMGISNIDTFDYRALLRPLAPDLATFQSKFDAGQLPHIKHFIRFQQEPARQFFKNVRDHMLGIDPSFRISSNTFDMHQELFYLAEENNSDFHGAEMELFLRWPDQFGKFMGRLKIADGLDIRIVTSGAFWNWEWARDQSHQAIETTKAVLAGMYASGHQLVVPMLYRWIEPQYCGSMPDFAPYYRFVRQNAQLFDDYQPVEQVGLILDNSVYGLHTGDSVFKADFEAICQALLDNRIPYGVAVGADGLFHRREFTRQELTDRFRYLVEPRNTALSGAQFTAVAGLKAEGKVHVWDAGGMSSLLPKIQSWVSCDKARVWALPRRHATDPGAPVIVHLLNRNIVQAAWPVGSTDVITPQAQVTIGLDKALWGAQQRVSRVTAFEGREGGSVEELAVGTTGDGISVIVPQLAIWTILRVELEAEPVPVISSQPLHARVAVGGEATFSVVASGDPAPTLQWQRRRAGSTDWENLADGGGISGATSATLVIGGVAASMLGDAVRVVAANSSGAVTSGVAVLSVHEPAARLLNLSTRAMCLTGDDVLIPGFVIGGQQPKRVLLRAVGPPLLEWGIQSPLPDPQMVLKRKTGEEWIDIASSDNWGSGGDAAAITAAAARVYAFPLDPDGKDAALVADLAPGLYSVVCSDVESRAGIALVEVYDADPAELEGGETRLLNISNRGFVGSGHEVMIPGFVVSADGPKTFLVRAVGPTLALWNVPGLLADPTLTVLRRQEGPPATEVVVAGNDNWGEGDDPSYTVAVAAQLHAFALNAGSKDAALVVTLAPGVYTAVVGGNASSGVALVELYVLP